MEDDDLKFTNTYLVIGLFANSAQFLKNSKSLN